MEFSLLFAPIFVQAILHKEFVGAKSDKLLGGGFFARRQLRIGRRGRRVARVGFSFPLLFLSPLFSEVSLALCKRIVWFCQWATLSIGVKNHK